MKERVYGCINPIPPAGKNEFFREACINPSGRYAWRKLDSKTGQKITTNLGAEVKIK